jgi:hypothetical protein
MGVSVEFFSGASNWIGHNGHYIVTEQGGVVEWEHEKLSSCRFDVHVGLWANFSHRWGRTVLFGGACVSGWSCEFL